MSSQIYKVIQGHRNNQQHKRNMKFISTHSNLKQDLKRNILLTSYKRLREQCTKFSQRERVQELAKENLQIRQRLMKIHDKRKDNLTLSYTPETTRRAGVSLPKLQEQINRQNKRMKQKLIYGKTQVLTNKELQIKYIQHLKHKMRLSKFSQEKDKVKHKNTVIANKIIALDESKSRSIRGKTNQTFRTTN